MTPDGRLRRVDADHDPELFWGLRGGFGAGAGVVIELEFRLLPITAVHAGLLIWPIGRAADVLTAWRELLPGLPDEITSTASLLRFPPLPDLPDMLRGQSFVVIDLISLLDRAATDAILASLRALGAALDTVRTMPAADLGDLHMDPLPRSRPRSKERHCAPCPPRPSTRCSTRAGPPSTPTCSRSSCATSAVP